MRSLLVVLLACIAGRNAQAQCVPVSRAESSVNPSFLWCTSELAATTLQSLNEHMTDARSVTIVTGAVVAASLSSEYRLPSPVVMKPERCGVANAYYRDGSITVCYELAEHLMEDFQRDRPTSTAAQRGLWVLKALSVIIAHEAGHALIARLDLPVLGGEELAADQFAIWHVAENSGYPMAMRFGEFVGYGYALTNLGQDYPEKGTSYADTHGFVLQRAFNLNCWVTGFAKTLGTSLDTAGTSIDAFEQSVPTDRVGSCKDEYLKLRNSWARLLGANLLRSPANSQH